MLKRLLITAVLAFGLAWTFAQSVQSQSPAVRLLLFGGSGTPAPAPFSLTATGTKIDSSNTTVITYNASGDPSCGAADATRVVIFIAWIRTTVTSGISSATIGGVAATQVSGALAANTNDSFSDIWQAAVPTGTTCTVVVTYANNAARSAIGVYRLVNGTATATSATSQAGTSVTSRSTTITVPTGGKAISGVGFKGTAAGSGINWTNATLEQNSGLFTTSYLSTAGTSAAGSVTITGAIASPTGTDNMAMSTAAWGP